MTSDDGARRGALSGVRVADFSRVLAGPYATMMLADFGADVLKIESPTGDDTRVVGCRRSMHPVPPPTSPRVNRNKRSVVLDLSTDAGLAEARRLAFSADVVVENFRPGVMERFGLDFAAVQRRQSRRRVLLDHGIRRRRRRRAAGLRPARAGRRRPDERDRRPRWRSDQGGGGARRRAHRASTRFSGILLALRARDAASGDSATGPSSRSTCSRACSPALVNQASSTLATGVSPQRMGNAHPSIAPYESFRAADRELVIAVGNDRQFQALAEVLESAAPSAAGGLAISGDERFATNPLRVAHRDELRAIIEEHLAGAPAAEWVARLNAVGVPAGLVNDVGEAIAFAEALGLAPVVDVADSRSIANPIHLASGPAAYHSRPPRLGEHAGADWLAASVTASSTDQLLEPSTEGTA